MKTEADQVQDGADKAVMLMKAVMRAMDEGKPSGFSLQNPLLVDACMRAAIGWHMVEAVRGLDLGSLALGLEEPRV
jgi:hypothetical protein